MSQIGSPTGGPTQVHGAFNFDRTVLAPRGTWVLVHEKPSIYRT
jgi:hypothetical protein